MLKQNKSKGIYKTLRRYICFLQENMSRAKKGGSNKAQDYNLKETEFCVTSHERRNNGGGKRSSHPVDKEQPD